VVEKESWPALPLALRGINQEEGRTFRQAEHLFFVSPFLS
jgi:hypothetical protein